MVQFYRGQAILYVESSSDDIKEITIVDLSGKIIFKCSEQVYLKQIDISGLGKGVYLINVYTDDSRVIKRIVKD